jgi:hypothetical protein
MHEFIISPIFNLKAIGVEISEIIYKGFLFNGEHHCSAPFPGSLHGSLRLSGTMVAYQFYHIAISFTTADIGVILYLLAVI